jgi:hypothetical protein
MRWIFPLKALELQNAARTRLASEPTNTNLFERMAEAEMEELFDGIAM